ATAPTLPSGFTCKARVGAIRAGAGPAFLNMMQKGRRAQYLVGTYGGNALANLPSMISGASGNVATPTWTAVAVANFVPSTASEIAALLINNTSPNSSAMCAPNNNYGNSSSTSNPPPMNIGISGGNSPIISVTSNLLLESANIYYASNAANGALFAFGWSDNI